MSVRWGNGVYRVCPVCGKAFFITDPEIWVYKREIQMRDMKVKTRIEYFDRYSCKRKFDRQYEAEIKQRKKAANQKRQKTRIERGIVAKPKDMTPEKVAKKAKKDAEIDARISGKTCNECKYCITDKFGFAYCSFQIPCSRVKAACRRFREKEMVVYG